MKPKDRDPDLDRTVKAIAKTARGRRVKAQKDKQDEKKGSK